MVMTLPPAFRTAVLIRAQTFKAKGAEIKAALVAAKAKKAAKK